MPFDLNSLDDVHRKLYLDTTAIMDHNYSPPLLWSCPKLSAWYAVALLGRDQPGDRERAEKLIHNSLTQQYSDEGFPQGLHSFKDSMDQPYASGDKPVWVSVIYDSYDPNNALFVALACIMIDALFADRISSELMSRFRAAVHLAVRGNIPRVQGWYGDDMCPSYSNPFFMRCVCSSYIGTMMGDKELVSLSDEWAEQADRLWDITDSPGEFNSPTYAGITLLALGLAKFCPSTSAITRIAPKLIASTWTSLGETYNPTLRNVAGPWDRTYGYCMTQYLACIGPTIAAVIQDDTKAPIPATLDGCPHYSDLAGVPMTMIISSYVESFLSQKTRQQFLSLTPHTYKAISDFQPYDKTPRQYTFSISDGLNIGGVKYDETRMGGPKGDVTQFVPAVIQWDSGKHGGGVGWIAMWPTTVCADISVTESSLSISLPPSTDGTPNPATEIVLHISSLPFMQLDLTSFTSKTQSLPGLDITLAGNVADSAARSLRFDKSTTMHGAKFYELTFTLDGKLGEGVVPRLELRLDKTTPPTYPLVW